MRQKTLSALLLSVLCLVLAEAQAAKSSTTSPDEAPVGKKAYKWIDHEGNVSYHDQPPPEGSKYKVEERILKGEKTPSKKSLTRQILRAPVVVYMIPKCLSCDMARTYLQRRKVPFTEKNVEGNRVLIEELKKKAGSLSVPTILVGEKGDAGLSGIVARRRAGCRGLSAGAARGCQDRQRINGRKAVAIGSAGHCPRP